MKKHFLSFALLCFFAHSLSAAEFRNVALDKTIDELEPLKGIVLWAGNSQMNTLKNSIGLEFLYYQPCKVVTGKSGGTLQYDWSSFDALLDAAATRGHQTIVRFYWEYPGTSGTITGATDRCTCGVAGATTVPLYIKNGSYGYSETYEANNGQFDGGQVYYAGWGNAELQWFAKQFYTDLAARYDADPRIAFVQVGFGYWGEYHIYGAANTTLGTNFPSKAYQTEFLQHIAGLFTETPWSLSKDADDGDYSPINGNATLKNLNFGVFDDSFMHQTHDMPQGCTLPWNCGDVGYNQYHINNLGTTRWQTAPFGGEISYYTSADQQNFLKPDVGIYGKTWEECAAQYHVSYMCGNDATTGSYATAARVKAAGLAAGYSFEITAYQVSDTEAKVTVKNNGVAPIYHHAYATVKGVRSATSLKGLLPGATRECAVSGLTIAGSESPDVTITSDKILAGKTIPYKADLQGETTSPPTNTTCPTLERIADNCTVKIITLQGITLVSGKEQTIDLSALPTGCYIVSYIAESGQFETKKILKY